MIDVESMIPHFFVDLPGIEKTLELRPFVVKEEKLLLMAASSRDENEIIDTTIRVVQNCIVSPHIDVSKLPYFLVDYLFITLRSKSVGPTIEVTFQCNNFIDSGSYKEKCNTMFPVEMDILQAKFNKEVLTTSKKIEFSQNSFGCYIRYPTYKQLKKISDNLPPLLQRLEIIKACLDRIYLPQGNVIKVDDMTDEEVNKFVDGLTSQQVAKLNEEIDNFPYFSLNVDHKCPHCGFDHHIEYRDFKDFF